MKKGFVKSFSIISAITIVSKLLGLVREMTMASVLGTGASSDAYVLGTTISQIVMTGLAGSFFQTYIPAASRLSNKSRHEYNRFTSGIAFYGSLFFLGLAVIIFIFADAIVPAIGSGASEETINNAIWICRATAIPSLFLLPLNVFQGYMHVQEKFWVNSIYPFIMSGVIITALVIGKGKLCWLTNAYNVSIIVPCCFLLVCCLLNGFRVERGGLLLSPDILHTMRITVPLLVGGMVFQLDEIIDRGFAGSFKEGTVSALRYGKLLEIFIVSAVGASIGQAIYPRLSKMVDKKEFSALRSLLSRIFNLLLIAFIPLTIFILFLRNDIVAIVFQRGAFNVDSVNNTAIAFAIYSFSIIPVSINEILGRVYYSFDDTFHPVIFSAVSMGSNIFLNYVVVYLLHLDFYFLAVTTVISETFYALMFLLGIHRKIHDFIPVNAKVLIFSLLGTGLLSLVLYFDNSILSSSWPRVILAILTGGGIYFLFIFLTCRQELGYLIKG